MWCEYEAQLAEKLKDIQADKKAHAEAERMQQQQELSFDNNSSYDSEDNSMDASAFVNKHCNFAEASMMASELGQSSSHVVPK